MPKAIPDYQGDVGKLHERIRHTSHEQAPFLTHDGAEYWRKATAESERLASLWQPLRDFILVRVIPQRNGEILLPPATSPQRQAVVVRVGPGNKDKNGRLRPLDVKPGDVVTIGPYDDWQNFAGDLVICQEADIRYIEVKHGRIV